MKQLEGVLFLYCIISDGCMHLSDCFCREIYASKETTQAKLTDPEHIYDTIGAMRSQRRSERLSQLLPPSASHSASSEQLYAATPALASSSPRN